MGENLTTLPHRKNMYSCYESPHYVLTFTHLTSTSISNENTLEIPINKSHREKDCIEFENHDNDQCKLIYKKAMKVFAKDKKLW